MQSSAVVRRVHLKIDSLKRRHEWRDVLTTHAINGSQWALRRQLTELAPPPAQLDQGSGREVSAPHRQFHSITLHRNVQRGFQLHQSNIVYVLIGWRVLLVFYELLGGDNVGTIAGNDRRSILNRDVRNVEKGDAVAGNGKPFENVKRHIKYLSSQHTGWKGLARSGLFRRSCALFLNGPRARPVSGTIWEILFSVRWTLKTISNHESVVIYSSIGAVYNERLNQIRIFSSAEPEQKHDEDARQRKTHFEWRNRFNWAELFRFKLKYEIENNGTIVIRRHSTQLLSLSQNALSSLRLSFVGEANGERRRQVTTRSTEQQELQYKQLLLELFFLPPDKAAGKGEIREIRLNQPRANDTVQQRCS